MRIQLMVLSLFFALTAMASPEEEIRALFFKYDEVMLNHNVKLVDEVFTQKFLKDNGGKKEFVKNIKSLPKPVSVQKSMLPNEISVKKSDHTEMYFVKLPPLSDEKTLQPKKSNSQFMVVKEKGKYKINGTLSDG